MTAATRIGTVCKRHPELGGLRFVRDGNCAECRRVTTARWQRENKDKKAAISKRYYAKNADALRAKARAEDDSAARYARYREASLKRAIVYRARNRERLLAYFRGWRKANLGKYNAAQAARRARKRCCAVELTPDDKRAITAIYIKARALTELIGEPYHVDHIKALAKGGPHHPANLQVLRGTENVKKGTR